MDAPIQSVPQQDAVSIHTLVERARDLLPLLRETAAANEANRRVAPEIMEALNKAGLLDLMKPARFGGHEFGPSAVIRVGAELGRADGAAAWCAMVSAISAWFVSYWPLQAQKDVWAENPRAIVGGVFVPTGKCEVADGGYAVSGRWPWASNCENVDWIYVSAMLADPETQEVGPALFLVPAGQLHVDQSTWHVAGMAGTGSKTVYADAPIFVPAHRVVRFNDIHSGKAPGQQLPDNPLSHFWFTTFAAAGLTAPLLGMARGALDWFAEPER